MLRAAPYIRVSTQEQTEGYSIEAQLDALKAYCKLRGMVISEIYMDPGFSGSDLERPGIQRLIRDVGQFDVVIVMKLDRLSRSQKDTLHLLEDVFLPANVDMISISESWDTSTPAGRAMIGMLSVFAQLEREAIRDRMLSGRVQRAKAGLHNGQLNTPIGYEKEGDRLVIVQDEAEQVREIFRLYLDGMAPGAILDHLNASGYVTRYGARNNLSTVRACLSNRVYLGEVSFAGEWYEGTHEPIIDEVTFHRVQDEIARRTKGGGTRSYLLSGLLWCGECGGRMAARVSGTTKRYACYNASGSSKRMVTRECEAPMWKVEALERVVLAEVRHIAFDDEYAASIIERISAETAAPPAAAQSIANLDKQIKRLMDLYQYQDAPIEEVSTRLSLLTAERKKASEELASSSSRPRAFNQQALDLVRSWDELSGDDRRNALRMLVDKVVVRANNIDFHWYA